MSIALGYNVAATEPSTGRQVFPDGEYNLIVSNAAQKATADNSGGMLVLTFKAIDGPMAGRDFLQYYNLWNKSAQAVEIAQRDISAIAHCIGRAAAVNAEDLLNVPFKAQVAVEETAKGKLNRITKYMDANGNDPKNAGNAAPAQAAEAAPAAAQAWGGATATAAPSAPAAASWQPNAAPATGGTAPWAS